MFGKYRIIISANTGFVQKPLHNFSLNKDISKSKLQQKMQSSAINIVKIYFIIAFLIKLKTHEWINKLIKLSLKKRLKLTKRYYSNPTANNQNVLDVQAK